MPNFLPVAAQAVWVEEYDRVVAGQTTDLDSSMFANYCALSAIIRAKFSNGEEPTAAYLVEARRLAEALGIGGPSSRVGKAVREQPKNAFAKALGTKQ